MSFQSLGDSWRDDETPRMRWYREQAAKGVPMSKLWMGPNVWQRIKIWWSSR